MDALTIDFKKKLVKGKISIKVFKENDFWIAYCPSLDLSGYAENPEEAQNNLFDVYMQDFFKSFFLDPQGAIEEMESLGWKRSKLLKKQFVSESYIDKDGFLKEFNLPSDTEVIEKELTV